MASCFVLVSVTEIIQRFLGIQFIRLTQEGWNWVELSNTDIQLET